MKTEEGRLKDQIKAHLASIKAYRFMPVQMGYGATTLDFLCCIKGRFVGIEAKAPGKKPTRRQELCIEEILAAGGIAFWTDSFRHYKIAMYQNDLLL
jgi:hypothetical protein